MTRDPSGEVEAITTSPSEVEAEAGYELEAAESSEPSDDEVPPDYDPTRTAALESDLGNLKAAAEELQED